MKNIILFLLCLIFSEIQAQFIDDFSDGDLTNNPTWQGNIDSFEVQNAKLWLNAPANTSASFLSTPSLGTINGTWEFDVELGFNPSSSNRALVYLMSDTDFLPLATEAYFVMIGNTTDEVSLYKKHGSTSTKIIDGWDGVCNSANVKARVKVSRDAFGNFELWVDTSLNFTNYISQDQVFDNTFMFSKYFGVLCEYSATRSDKFWFDNFSVNTQVFTDIISPQLKQRAIVNLHEVQLVFNENIDSASLNLPNNFLLNGLFAPVAKSLQDSILNLGYYLAFQNDSSYEIAFQVLDLSGNELDSSINFSVSDNYPFQTVLLNEIYADETPSFGMPNYEFVELKNTSADTLILENWKFADAADTIILPLDTLLPFEYLILCKSTGALLYESFGKVLEVPNLPSLNNAGDALLLLNKYDQILDSVSYQSAWFRGIEDDAGNLKSNGGYSLERISDNYTCAPSYHWWPSDDTLGATPGKINSKAGFIPEAISCSILDVSIENDSTFLLSLSQELPLLSAEFCSILGNEVEQVFSFNQSQFYVVVANPIVPSQKYSFEIQGVADCYGSLLLAFEKTFFWVEAPVPGDIIINEILFNPHSGGSDFLELYNTSNKAINLEGFKIWEYDPLSPSVVLDSVIISKSVMEGKAYWVITEDTANIQQQYYISEPAWLQEQTLSNFPDDQGIVVLKLPSGITADSVYFEASWHLDLLDLQDGVSLERVSALAPSTSRNSWHSAAKTYAYGTPTAINSQAYLPTNKPGFSITPNVFTPNDDGYKDYCVIAYEAENWGAVASVEVFDIMGRKVKLLAQNHSLGNENTWKWDGTNMQLNKAEIGIYFVLIEIVNENGKKEILKEKVVLGAQLN
jgi:hypothetical protein